MAYRDYIHCTICDCKFIYDGNDDIRNQWGEDKRPIIICGDCASKVRIMKKKGNKEVL